ncbi:hypothetical protein [Haloarcula pelagica]|uniref:hypothetical protein n=1 Tax=Haloarcula pelagica TaxID=3033389 RepID=UPI0024C40BCF|nr:hypothetical protein [Halomicroarcula sp. YJ-61-S]
MDVVAVEIVYANLSHSKKPVDSDLIPLAVSENTPSGISLAIGVIPGGLEKGPRFKSLRP